MLVLFRSSESVSLRADYWVSGLRDPVGVTASSYDLIRSAGVHSSSRRFALIHQEQFLFSLCLCRNIGYLQTRGLFTLDTKLKEHIERSTLRKPEARSQLAQS